MSFDLAASLRRIGPQRRAARLHRRPDEELPFISADIDAGAPLMLDTTVYIDRLQGRSPAVLAQALDVRPSNHSSVAVGELTHLFGRLDPADPRTAPALVSVTTLLERLPRHRLTAPSVRAHAEAGMLSGFVDRLRGDGRAVFNDALLYLHAVETGCAVLTRNIADFDALLQLAPFGQVLFYRTA